MARNKLGQERRHINGPNRSVFGVPLVEPAVQFVQLPVNVDLVAMHAFRRQSDYVPGGFWVAAADPAVVSHSLTGEIPLRTIHRVILLTDGAARPFKLYDWPGIFSAVANEGPSGLIKQVRIAEDADPTGSQHPRNKIHDNATVAVITL